MRVATMFAGLLLTLSTGCGRMPEEEKFVEATIAGGRAGTPPTYQFPEGIHDETKEAAAAIKGSTSYKMEKPGYGMHTEACFNGTLSGPTGDRPLAVVIQRVGGFKVVEMSVKHPCTCTRGKSRVSGVGDCYLTNPR